MSSDLHYLSLDEVARRLKARKLSSVEATRAILDRIDKLDPKLKSYATVTPERALQDAARLDAETAAGKSRGTLHGVPIAVKDLCNTAGVPTAAGMAIHRQHVPAKDATVVARLEAGGRGDPGQAADDRGRLWPASSDDRAAGQSLERGLLDRRVVVGLGRGDGGRPLLRLAGLRYRRVDPLSLDHERPVGPQADLGPGEPRRRLSARRIARPCRADVPQRARLRR